MLASESVPHVGLAGFQAAVRSSGVLSDSQLDRAARSFATARSSADAAKALVGLGLLTPFQAERLLKGKPNGLVLGQYVLLEPIGAGADGRVFRARHRTMNRLVAVKVLATEFSHDPARREAFQAEGRAAARLAHSNIVTLLDANQLGGRLYVVREYVDGTGVDAVVRRDGPLPVSAACEVVRQAALGLQHAHEKGTPHGSFDPTQILIGRPLPDDSASRPVVKVKNFGMRGLAAAREDATPGAVDPLDFQAPELAHPGAHPTAAADLYSLGATLFYLLTGHPVHALNRGFAPPAAWPPALLELVLRLTANDPQARPRSVAEVLSHLDAFAESNEQIDFSMPSPGLGESGANGILSGLPPRHTADVALPTPSPIGPMQLLPTPTNAASPWEELDAGRTLEGVASSEATPLVIRRPAATDQRTSHRTMLVGLAGVVMVAVISGVVVLMAAAR